MKRREFIKYGAGGAIGAAALGGLTSNWYGLYASEVADPGTDGTRVIPSFCELCFWKCGIRAHVKAGRVTKITGNPNDPLSNGMLCPRGLGGTGLLYDPDRLKQPLVRVGSRGGDRFEEVSWEVALDEAASRLDKIKTAYGASAMALFSHGYGGSWFKHLFKAYGSTNIAAPSYAQCRGPRDVGFSITYGSIVGSPEVTDMANSRAIALIGSHLGENMHNTQVQDFAAAIRKGADIIVVDPRFSVAASKARYWLPIRPGTDLALLLAWLNVLITEELYDRSYVDRYAYGFDQLKTHVQAYTPEWAYPRTGIEPQQIRDSAHLLAGARPASLVHPGRHVTWYGDDTQRSRAIAMLNALLGSWGRRGGFYIPAQMEIPAYPGLPAYPHTEAAKVSGNEAAPAMPTYPLADEVLAQGVCDASITGGFSNSVFKGWMVYGSNLPTTLPNPKQTYKALQELEAIVTIDVLPMEIVGWSDVVLPESTYLERWDDLNAPGYREPYVGIRQAVVAPMYESRPGWWIAKELGKRLGLADYFPWHDAESFVRERIKGAGLDFDRLQQHGVLKGPALPIYFEEGVTPEFATDSGKIELYSAQLAGLGFDPMPTWHDGELEEPPPGYYRLLFGRAPNHTFGRTANNRVLSNGHAEAAVWVNRAVAEKWQLQDGDRIHLQNQDGVKSTFSAPVKVTERIRPDAVYLVHGYGHTSRKLRFAHGKGIDDSELITRYKVDPIMGGTGMNVNFVTFVRASAASEVQA